MFKSFSDLDALALSIMGLVGLTGALLIGAAFAPPEESNHEHLVCHYQKHEAATEFTPEQPFAVGGGGMETVQGSNRAEWSMINMDTKALVAHFFFWEEGYLPRLWCFS